MSRPLLPFTPIKTYPQSKFPWWYSNDPGYTGINPCRVMIANGLVLPNCTGWAWGAFAYHANLLTGCELPGDRDAINWYGDTRISYDRGSAPKLGAVICFADGPTSPATAGHVAVVEEIADDGSYIWTSESNYEHWQYPFRYCKRYRSTGWNVKNTDYPDLPREEWYYEDMIFQGFIYAPVDYYTGGGIIPLKGGVKRVRKRIYL